MFTVALALGVYASGCANSPDLDRIRDYSEPEAVLYKWLVDQTGRVLVGDLEEWPLLKPCWLTIDSLAFDLENEKAEEALRVACARLQDIDQKYEGMRRFREWSLESPFLRPPWREIAGEAKNLESGSCCEHLLKWEDFSSEIRDTRDRLRSDLVCGFDNDYLYDGEHRCRGRGSLPILIQTLPQAVSVVEEYLQDSAEYHASRCKTEACKEEYGTEDKSRENLINHVLATGKFEPFESSYSRPGEWQVLLVASWPESEKELIECFKVINKPGKYTELRKVVDAGYPWVIHCGGFSRLGEGYFHHDGSLVTRRMSD